MGKLLFRICKYGQFGVTNFQSLIKIEYLQFMVLLLMQSDEAKFEQTLENGKQDLERFILNRKMHLAKQEECMKKIRDLGSLPSDAFDT
jgi:hypothetical protein